MGKRPPAEMSFAPAQVSFAGAQSLSRLPDPVLQPAGQHWSPPRQVRIALCEHFAVHELALPVSTSVVQALPSLGQLLGQVPGGSQVSPFSIMPLPQPAQSLS